MSQPAHAPLTFVQIKVFGENLFIAQVSPTPEYLILSSHYTLTPLVALPQIIHSYLGSQADFINLNKEVYTLLIKAIVKSNDERVSSSDSLLLARAFWFLNTKFNFSSNQSIQISDADIDEAIQSAIESDDMIKDLHYNLVSSFIEKQKELSE